MEQQSAGAWEVLTIVAAVWSATSLAGAAAQALKPRPVDLRRQAVGALLAGAGLAATVVLLGIEVDKGAAAWALVLGLAVGYGTSTLAGYRDDAGEAVAPGSVWFILPWGISASGLLWGALATSDTGLALGVLGMFASTGVGLGQLPVAALAVRKVAHDWDARPVPPGIDLVAALLAEGESTTPPFAAGELPSQGIESCPNGHELPQPGLHFCPRCGASVRCPNGHLISAADAAFCVECGSPVRELARQR